MVRVLINNWAKNVHPGLRTLYRHNRIQLEVRIPQRPTSSQPPPRIFKKMPPTRHIEDETKTRYVMLIVPITAFGLGCWQVQRLKWKQNLIDYMDNRTRKPPAELPEDLQELNDSEYCKFKVHGRFDHAREILIRPRTLLEESGGGMISQGVKPGSLVVTPFFITQGPHRGQTILINRGWVAKDREDPNTRLEGQIQNDTEIVGLLRRSEYTPWFVTASRTGDGQWLIRDIEAMADHLDTLPIFLDAVKTTHSFVRNVPLGGQTHVQLRNNHLQYILTWFGLAAATTLMWFKMYKFPHKNVMKKLFVKR